MRTTKRVIAFALITLWLELTPRIQALAAGSAETGRPLLITVDDLPIGAGSSHPDADERERITRGLLAALEKHQIHAIAVITWANLTLDSDRKLLELWLDAGHELGNHSNRHLSYTQTEVESYIADIEEARSKIADFLKPHGRTLRYFRFPFLREGDTPEKLDAMRAYLAKTGQRNLPVTIDNQDWSYEAPWVAARKKGDAAAMKRVSDEYLASILMASSYYRALGDELFERPVPQILLLHANEVGAANWDALFTSLADAGFRFAEGDEVMADPTINTPHRYVGAYGPSLWERIVLERRREQVEADVRKTIDDQMAAWNRGDLDAFCSVYAEDATFVSPKGVTHGRAGVLDRYRKSYPDRAAMGTLSLEISELRQFSGLEDSVLGNAQPGRVHAVSVAARWTLKFEGKAPATGSTLLVFNRHRGHWQIVQDASM